MNSHAARNISLAALIFFALIATILPAAAHAQTRMVRIIAPTVATTNPGFGRVVKNIPTTTPYGHDQLQLRVIRSVPGEGGRTYFLVHLPYRPNGLTGWIASDKVQVVTTPYHIKISRSQRRAQLYKNAKLVMSWRVVVGKASTPTPSGEFQVYGKTTRNHSFDGTGILVFGYSNVHMQFDGGPGMVGIHGRSGASLSQPLGTAGSNGCIRSDNAVIERLLPLVPIGTPVSVR